MGGDDETHSELCYTLTETVDRNFYLPVQECKHFVLFSNCEITTDWYVIKLVYVYIMEEEDYRVYKGNYL